MITRQIGWSNESNLLYQILKQIKKLSSIIFNLKQEATPKYKVFTALLSQEFLSEPEAIVLENTIGNITFSYINEGEYSINSDSLFLQNKTTVNIDSYGSNGNIITSISYYITSVGIINIFTFNSARAENNILSKTRIEIRVYN